MDKLKVSNSIISNFRGCSYRWLLENVFEKERVPSLAMEFGTACHAWLENFYTIKRDNNFIPFALENLDLVYAEEEDFINRFERFCQYYSGNTQKVYDWKSTEIKEIEFKMEYEFENFKATGIADLVVEENKQTWIVDHKISGRQNFENFEVSFQGIIYCWLYWKTTGIMPAGIIYNIISSNPPNKPKILKSGELSKDKNQRVQALDYEYKAEEIAKAKGEEVNEETWDFIKFLKMNEARFFERISIPYEPEQIQQAELIFKTTAHQMLNLTKRWQEDFSTSQEIAFEEANPSMACGSCQVLAQCSDSMAGIGV